MSFKKMEFAIPVDNEEQKKVEEKQQTEKVESKVEEEKKEEVPVEDVKKDLVKITSVEGVDIRAGLHHTFICLNNYEHVFVLGYYDKSAQSQEEILHTPKYLSLCKTFNIQKVGTQRHKSVIVAQKKDTKNVQIMIGQFAPLVKEDSFKRAQFDIDFSENGPNKVTQIYVRNDLFYLSTAGNFKIDPYDTKEDPSFKRGLSAQGLKQCFQPSHQKQAA